MKENKEPAVVAQPIQVILIQVRLMKQKYGSILNEDAKSQIEQIEKAAQKLKDSIFELKRKDNGIVLP